MGSLRHHTRLIVVAAAVIVIAAVCVYFYFDPGDSVLFPKCVFLSVTGLQCPGCGSQRAIHALLHGDIAAAWGFNAMLIIFIPVLTVLFAAEFMRKSHPRFYMAVNSRFMIIGCFVVITAWSILRNIF